MFFNTLTKVLMTVKDFTKHSDVAKDITNSGNISFLGKNYIA